MDGYLMAYARCSRACMFHVVHSVRCKLAIGVVGANETASASAAWCRTVGPIRRYRGEVSEMQDAKCKMQVNANKRYPKPSELRRPSNASGIVDTKTVIPNGRNSQKQRGYRQAMCQRDSQCEGSLRRKASGMAMAKLRRTAAGHHT